MKFRCWLSRGGTGLADRPGSAGVERLDTASRMDVLRDVTKWRDLNTEEDIKAVRTAIKRQGGRYVPDCISIPIVDYQSGMEALKVLVSSPRTIQEMMFEFRHVASGGTLRLFELAGHRSSNDRVHRPNLKFLFSALSDTACQKKQLRDLPPLVRLMVGDPACHTFITAVHEDMAPDCWEEYLVGFAKWLPTVGLTSFEPQSLF